MIRTFDEYTLLGKHNVFHNHDKIQDYIVAYD